MSEILGRKIDRVPVQQHPRRDLKSAPQASLLGQNSLPSHKQSTCEDIYRIVHFKRQPSFQSVTRDARTKRTRDQNLSHPHARLVPGGCKTRGFGVVRVVPSILVPSGIMNFQPKSKTGLFNCSSSSYSLPSPHRAPSPPSAMNTCLLNETLILFTQCSCARYTPQADVMSKFVPGWPNICPQYISVFSYKLCTSASLQRRPILL